jgi:hypothetical protein
MHPLVLTYISLLFLPAQHNNYATIEISVAFTVYEFIDLNCMAAIIRQYALTSRNTLPYH